MSNDKVHYPANPEKFEFDDQVAAIFPDMAERSIPLYREMHNLHARIVLDAFYACEEESMFASVSSAEKYIYSILDIGASHGDFGKCLKNLSREGSGSVPAKLRYIASDRSIPMASRIDKGVVYDIADPHDILFEGQSFDTVCMHYVMQFIPVAERSLVYQRLGQLVKPGGLLLFGEKETLLRPGKQNEIENHIARSVGAYYIDFRKRNGYSINEIQAKTKALKNSMWEVAYEHDTKRNLQLAGFDVVVPLTRMGLFHSFVAIRDAQHDD